jgi:hypothetical protein
VASRYRSGVPMSIQYPTASYPNSPPPTSDGKTSRSNDTGRPGGMLPTISSSST